MENTESALVALSAAQQALPQWLMTSQVRLLVRNNTYMHLPELGISGRGLPAAAGLVCCCADQALQSTA